MQRFEGLLPRRESEGRSKILRSATLGLDGGVENVSVSGPGERMLCIIAHDVGVGMCAKVCRTSRQKYRQRSEQIERDMRHKSCPDNDQGCRKRRKGCRTVKRVVRYVEVGPDVCKGLVEPG